jgi:hypothetical protein
MVGLLILGGNGMLEKASTAARLITMGVRAFLSSNKVFVVVLLERSGYFIYHQV